MRARVRSRRSSGREFAKRWEALNQRSRYAGIRPEFKAWVADLRTLLASAHEFLIAEERALFDLAAARLAPAELAEMSRELHARRNAKDVRR